MYYICIYTLNLPCVLIYFFWVTSQLIEFIFGFKGMLLKDVESSMKSIRNEVFVAQQFLQMQAMERLSQSEKRRDAVVRDLGCDLNVGVTSGAACFSDKRGATESWKALNSTGTHTMRW